MELISKDRNYSQLCIFPEGTTTNGKGVMKFKHGSFFSLTPIQPIYMKYRSPFCNPSFDIIPTLLHLFYVACQPFIIIEIHRMPVIFPTEEMFEKYKSWGESKVEVYCEVARDIYCKSFGLSKLNQSFINKQQLKIYLFDNKELKIE